jgi:hypothetical protein
MTTKKQREKRKFIIGRLGELSLLPITEELMNEEQKEIYNQIWNFNFDYWEKVKRQNGWLNCEKRGNSKDAEKRRSVRTYLREKGILPPYMEKMTEEQQEISDQIDKNDFSYYNKMVTENKNKHQTSKYKINKETNVDFTSNSLPKMVLFSLRRLQILPPIKTEHTQEQLDIIEDVKENWSGKVKSFFIHKYLHLSTPEGRLYYRLYKTHQDYGFNFNLGHSDIIIPTHCPLLGLELSTDPKDKDQPNYYTGDRIDSSKGLVKGNLQVISMRANKMKNKATENELLQFATNALKLFDNENKS